MTACAFAARTLPCAFATRSWSPILDGEIRAVAGNVLRDIARAIPLPGAKDSNSTLADGDAGYAIFNAYLVMSGLLAEPQRERHRDLMMAYLQSALDKLPTMTGRPDLVGGFTGVAWAVNHLNITGALHGYDDLCDPVDDALLEWVRDRSNSMLCELLTGLSGIGLYALGRRHRPVGREIVRLVVSALEASAVEHRGFRTWFNPPEKLPPHALRSRPHGCYNLGVSHGVPGAIAFLAQAAGAGVPLAGELATHAAAWLFAQQRPYRNGSRFAYSFLSDPMEDAAGSRLAWCYGDLGNSAALLLSARCMRDPDWEASALEIARNAARRSIDTGAVMDAGLCHGAFGNAHAFRRLHAATRDDCFLEAALRWVHAGVAMRREGLGPAGFRAWLPAGPNEPARDPWRADSGLFTGICGIGLALLGLISPIEPQWDEVLMLNIPTKEA